MNNVTQQCVTSGMNWLCFHKTELKYDVILSYNICLWLDIKFRFDNKREREGGENNFDRDLVACSSEQNISIRQPVPVFYILSPDD